MDLPEQAGYALASWARFDGAISDELTRAITSGFALVVCADGDVAQSEVQEFAQTLTRFEQHLPALDIGKVQRLFKDISGAILSDPVAGKAKALDEIGLVKTSAESAELVRSAAEIALAADQRTRDSETSALQAICQRLGLEPR